MDTISSRQEDHCLLRLAFTTGLFHSLYCSDFVPLTAQTGISRNFRNARQEDAHEYMVNLLESMHKCCLPSGVPSESPSAYEKSLVHKIFGGSLRSQVVFCYMLAGFLVVCIGFVMVLDY